MGDRPDVIKELNEKVAARRVVMEAQRQKALADMKEKLAQQPVKPDAAP